MNELRYNHDCSECIYLGTYQLTESNYPRIKEYDLYVHERETIVELIARYGNNPTDYLNGCYFLGYPLNESLCLERRILE